MVPPPRRRFGFTLIEVLVSLAIVAVLAALVAPMVIAANKRGKEQELRVALRQIRQAVDDYKLAADQGRVLVLPGQTRYPPSLAALATGVADLQDAQGRRIYFLRRVPRDPFAGNSQQAAEETWGLRSSQSDPDKPEPGADVFDVYSRSDAIGLNGVPYRQW
ncbi:MAG: type II secretion system protein [Burkholderiales bacterium]|nr:type II secretion system protein [Burkholderiales bacterium]